MNCCKLPVNINISRWVTELSFIDIYRAFLENCFMLEKEDNLNYDNEEKLEKINKATNTQIYLQPGNKSSSSVSSNDSYEIIEDSF